MGVADEICEIALPEHNDFPCSHPARFIYLDLVLSERLGKPKTIYLCQRHKEFLDFTQDGRIGFGCELTLIGRLRNFS